MHACRVSSSLSGSTFITGRNSIENNANFLLISSEYEYFQRQLLGFRYTTYCTQFAFFIAIAMPVVAIDKLAF